MHVITEIILKQFIKQIITEALTNKEIYEKIDASQYEKLSKFVVSFRKLVFDIVNEIRRDSELFDNIARSHAIPHSLEDDFNLLVIDIKQLVQPGESFSQEELNTKSSVEAQKPKRKGEFNFDSKTVYKPVTKKFPFTIRDKETGKMILDDDGKPKKFFKKVESYESIGDWVWVAEFQDWIWVAEGRLLRNELRREKVIRNK